jgi:acetyl-CoA carboxylase biotin carboxyl carrier protein
MDLDQLASLLKMLHEHEVSEFTFRDKEQTIRLRIGPPPAPVAPMAPVAAAALPAAGVAASPPSAPAPAAAPAGDEAGVVVIESPMVGTFYTASSPGAPAFADVGSTVQVGQTLCIVEAMKLMNQIESEIAGTVVARLVENGRPVEFGQPLFKIRKA